MSALVLLLTGYVFIVVCIKFYRRNSLPLPPGPPAEPILGHLRSIPPSFQERTFYEWGKIYGDVMHLYVPGRTLIVLNSVQAAIDLLEKRSANYSDRPQFIIYELMGWNPQSSAFLQYGEQFRRHRKMFQDYFRRGRTSAFCYIQTEEAHGLIRNLISKDGHHDDFLRRFSAAIVVRVAYGQRIVSDDDRYLQIVEENGVIVSNSGSIGSTPVDLFPFLQHMPSWFPGAYYAHYARESKDIVSQLRTYPYGIVKKQMAEGTAEPSFLASQLESCNREGAADEDTIAHIQSAAGTLYGAAADTTWTSMSVFLLAMVMHPEWQIKAQEELDAVIGTDRLPRFEDRGSLPYIDCLLQESLRWNPAVPLGIPHRSVEDDVYKGMFIPKGSIVFANTKGMALDENVYSNPLEFRPTRFLPKPVGDGEPPLPASFGFGRRICPGRYLADASLWIAIASILSTLTISKSLDEEGKEITPAFEFSSGLTSHPKPYKCIIRPRTDKARLLILQTNDWN